VDPFQVVIVTVRAKVGRELWEGVGWFMAPTDPCKWGAFPGEVATAFWQSALHFLDVGTAAKAKAMIEPVTVIPHRSARIRRMLAEMDSGERPRVVWTCLSSERFELGGEG